jgi:hypothetical protein
MRQEARCLDWIAIFRMNKYQLSYVAGADAKATFAMRLQMRDEAFRKAMDKQLFR